MLILFIIAIYKNKNNYESFSDINKIILVTEYFRSNHEARYKEIYETLIENINNENIDLIYVITEKEYDEILDLTKKYPKLRNIMNKDRLTFQKGFEISNMFKNNIVMLSNNDIIFDKDKKTFDNIRKVLSNNKNVIAATRRKSKTDMTIDTYGSQDVWMFNSPIKIPENSNFFFGKLGCDNRIAFLLHQNYDVKNYPEDIIIIHNHENGIRTYTVEEIIEGDYYFPTFEKL